MKNTLNYIVVILLHFPLSGQTNLKELKTLNDKAFKLYENNSIPEAENLAKQLTIRGKSTKPTIYNGKGYILLGIINKNKGYYITSLENYLHALTIAEKINDKGRISACLNNIGVIYQLQKNYAQAIKYFSKSLEIEEKDKNSIQKSIRYFNLGDSYKELDSLDIALSYYNNSLIIEEKQKSNEGIVFAYLGIAEVYLKLHNLFQAKLILDKIQHRLTREQLEEKILYLKLNGDYFIQSSLFDTALDEINKSIEFSVKNNFNSYLLELYLMKITCQEKTGAIGSANESYKQYIKKSDELSNSTIKNKIEDLTYQNELTKKELEIKLVLEERNLAKKNEDFEKRLRLHEQKITVFVILFLLTFIGLVIYGIKKLTNFSK